MTPATSLCPSCLVHHGLRLPVLCWGLRHLRGSLLVAWDKKDHTRHGVLEDVHNMSASCVWHRPGRCQRQHAWTRQQRPSRRCPNRTCSRPH